eukprot:11656731-Karenia_brevis.AAC.1
MLKQIPRKEVCLVDPMRVLENYAGGKLCESSYNVSFGPEHVNRPRIPYDLSDILPQEVISAEIWPGFSARTHSLDAR